ncbi:hypothetical protein [Cryobacterium sp. Y82]|uniref:hypothetical protein n=1 Tax=Cryobacterium sp. Y82 TaxID=2045017 RepID=UPI001304B0E4|nr:hypothetical protein [Cryobacterium sp. Y82]
MSELSLKVSRYVETFNQKVGDLFIAFDDVDALRPRRHFSSNIIEPGLEPSKQGRAEP